MVNTENPNKWVSDICKALNDANVKMPDHEGGNEYTPDRFSHPYYLITNHVAYSNSLYQYLNDKGLVNRGFCPVTGESINNQYSYKFFDRKIYMSQSGIEECKKIKSEEHLKLTGRLPLSNSEKSILAQNIRTERKSNRLENFAFLTFLIIIITFLIKKCS